MSLFPLVVKIVRILRPFLFYGYNATILFYKQILIQLIISYDSSLELYLFDFITFHYYFYNVFFSIILFTYKKKGKMEFNETAKKRYDELEIQEADLKKEFEKKVADIRTEKVALKRFLISVGVIEIKKRGRRKKTAEASS